MPKIYKSLQNFFGLQTKDRLFEYACGNEVRFLPTKVTSDGKTDQLDPSYRISNKLRDLGEMDSIIRERVMPLVPDLIQELGLTPFQPSGLEIEMVAHGDGAFYKWHIDTFTGTGRSKLGSDRLISLVYYFYREPKSFTGGALRLYPLPKVDGSRGEHIDIVPEQDMAVAFPSWLPHEVLKVTCPSGEFADNRFAINCWVLRGN